MASISNHSIKLTLRGITKSFPGVKALDNVSMEIRPGEVHAVCGENGAGKSSLMKILTGNYAPDAGEIRIDGVSMRIESQKHAQELGIGIVYQERSLVDKLSVAENIFPTRKPVNRLGLIDRKRLKLKTRELLDRLRLKHISPDDLTGNLSVANQQMIEIAKALSQEPRVLILDEPTASITEEEVSTLFGLIRDLRNEGVAVIYVSHRMSEIFTIANTVSVLKDGRHQGTYAIEALSVDTVIRLMVGRDISRSVFSSHATDEVVLEVDRLTGTRFRDVSFRVRKGEIVALAGLMGAGRTEVARAIFGADDILGGQVRIHGRRCSFGHPAEAIRNGIVYIPEDRKTLGLFPEMSIEDNIASAQHNVSGKGTAWISRRRVTECADEFIRLLKIKCTDHRQRVAQLSGGNQQKVVLAKWLSLDPALLIVDEPTHGIDVGAKDEIYSLLRKLTAEGMAILLISSELPEVLALSDRIVVMYNGIATAVLDRKEANEEAILHYASGTRTKAVNV